jgi:hypothetical protein
MDRLNVVTGKRPANALVFSSGPPPPSSKMDCRVKFKIYTNIARKAFLQFEQSDPDVRLFLRIAQKTIFIKYSNNLDIYAKIAEEIATAKDNMTGIGFSDRAQRFLRIVQQALLGKLMLGEG